MLCWFGTTAGVALVAWTRAARAGHPRPWIPPAVALLVGLLVLLALA